MKQFCIGSDMVNLAVSSGLLEQSWKAISELQKSVIDNADEHYTLAISDEILKCREPNCTIVAFIASPHTRSCYFQSTNDLLSSEEIMGQDDLFKTICSKIPGSSFKINNYIIQLFRYVYEDLVETKSQIDQSIPLIITGISLGGSIASLFTLWLLETMDLKKMKRPLCITYGSLLLGDNDFQRLLYDHYPTWNSCFLHVASDQDTGPTLGSNNYKPFGMYLMCSKSGCAYLENPDSVLDLFSKALANSFTHNQPMVSSFCHYSEIVQNLTANNAIYCKDKDTIKLPCYYTNPFHSGIALQLSKTLGSTQTQQTRQPYKSVYDKESKFLFGKKKIPESKTLNNNKKFMAYMEWYKKVSKDTEIGYYDSYKSKNYTRDIKVEEFKKRLKNYWIDVIELADKEGTSLRTALYEAGQVYRKMVEPLDIADYYGKEGNKNYREIGRSFHYKRLEEYWIQKEKSKPASTAPVLDDSRKKVVSAMQTEDSCFWADVEEAIMNLDELKRCNGNDNVRECLVKKLEDFENYVYNLLKNYAVSPEIFLKDSSFMIWWGNYKKFSRPCTSFTEFMKSCNYKRYETGNWEPVVDHE